MGFYLRKSINVGPVRFNLSQSGIGLSTGIKGFRVGTGPRGNYVHMARSGIYFRQTIPSVDQPAHRPVSPSNSGNGINFETIASGSVDRMVDSSSAALLAEINEKSKKARLWPIILGFGVVTIFATAAASAPTWIYWLLVPIFAGAVAWAVQADKLRKTVVLFYELESHIETAYQSLHNAFDTLRKCSQVWHVDSKGNVTTTHDWKVNAGAGHLVTRRNITPFIGAPVYFQSNIAVPVLPSGGQTLYFLPDRILVWTTNGVGAVAFDQVEVSFNDRRFIEDGRVPADSKVVDKTWRYINKKGGPDRRFNNNRELPIVLYDEVMLTSKSGLREMFQASRTGVGKILQSSIKQMASSISEAEKPKVLSRYIKCACSVCAGSIEFPAHGVGQSIACPHCGAETVLFGAQPPQH